MKLEVSAELVALAKNYRDETTALANMRSRLKALDAEQEHLSEKIKVQRDREQHARNLYWAKVEELMLGLADQLGQQQPTNPIPQ